MIFDRFFTPKYKSKDVDVRLQALDKLDLSKTSDKQIAHELAFNDSSTRVILAALEKLHSFPLWLKASEISEHKSVKTKALDRVLKELDNNDSDMLSEKDFFTFCTELTNTVLLEKLVLTNHRLQALDDLVLACLARIDKDNVTRLYFKQTANEYQQLTIVKQTTIHAELNKLSKLACTDAVSALIAEKINNIQEAAARPAALKQQASLVTSKLLASKDLNDYAFLLSEQQRLVSDFESIKPEFSVLKEDEAYEIAGKFLAVNASIEKRLSDLKGDWEYNQSLSATTNAIADIEEQINQVVGQIEALSVEQDLQNLNSQSKILSLSLQDASSNLVEIEQKPRTKAHEQWTKRLFVRLDLQQKTLADLPLMCELNQSATTLIEQFSVLVDEVNGFESEEHLGSINAKKELLRASWKQEIINAAVPVSNSLSEKWKALSKTYKSFTKAHIDEQIKLQKRAVNKLKVVQGLIDQGKFKPAIASFAYAQSQVLALSESNRASIDKMYQDLAQKIADLQGLQAFIAAPRKPALLAEAQALAAQALDDVKQRVAQVKQLRAQWSSFGQLNTEEDNTLNKAFDEAVEQAFLPCREHFAKQEMIRAENKNLAISLIEELRSLATSENIAALAKAFVSIQKQFRALGQLENNDYKALQKQFKEASLPVTKQLDAFYLANYEQKAKLVKQAEKLAQDDDLKAASSLAKSLQSQWRTIGYAGKKQDDALWKQFRQANDQLFTKLGEHVSEIKEAEQEQYSAAKNGLQSLRAKLTSADSLRTLDDLDSAFTDVEQAIQLVTDKRQRELQKQLSELASKRNDKRASCVERAESEETIHLFAALSKWTQQALPGNVSTLNNKAQNMFKQAKLTEVSRKELTIMTEIVAEIDSIKADAKLRKELQLKMMASRLEGHALPSLDVLLAQWISHGCLQEGDSSLLKRMKQVFLPSTTKTKLDTKTASTDTVTNTDKG